MVVDFRMKTVLWRPRRQHLIEEGPVVERLSPLAPPFFIDALLSSARVHIQHRQKV